MRAHQWARRWVRGRMGPRGLINRPWPAGETLSDRGDRLASGASREARKGACPMWTQTHRGTTVRQYRAARLAPWRMMRRGIRQLDATLNATGYDWRTDANPATLDMGHDQRCLLAQMEGAQYGNHPDYFPSYGTGLGMIGLTNGWRHGFDIPGGHSAWGSGLHTARQYARLTESWRAYLTGHLVIREVGTAK
jgi:hypothetical protein